MSDSFITPSVRYALSGGLNIAYQVFGDGPIDVIMVPGFISHIEYGWQEPLLARFLRLLSGYSRVIMFDKRGMGLSDRDPAHETPDLPTRVADVAAVLDAVESRRAAVLAWSEGGPAAVAFADTHPDRTAGLVLIATTARFVSASDFPFGIPHEALETFIDTMRTDWGTGVGYDLYVPSLADDERMRAWWAAYQRFASTPGAVAASLTMQLSTDVRALLPGVEAPALVLHRTHDMVVPVECGRYLGEQLPAATYIEMPGDDHMYWVGHQERTLDHIRSFLSRCPGGDALAGLRRTQTRARKGWESLTRAELDVIRLLVGGLTNAQIAARLTISPRTVQTHLGHIHLKLNMHRRTEIAAEAVRRGL